MVHLAIFTQPYLDLILLSRKTIESRFSKHKIAPYLKVNTGDLVLMKESGGLILGEFTVGEVNYYNNIQQPETIKQIKSFSNKIFSDVDPNFWESRNQAQYATLIEVVSPVKYDKALKRTQKKSGDRRSWIVL